MQIRIVDRLIVFFRAFEGFYTVFFCVKESPNLSALRQEILDEIYKKNGKKSS